MSRNDLVLVICDRRHGQPHFVVVEGANADLDWNMDAAARLASDPSFPRLRSRARALVLAHDIHNRAQSEYGVREMTIGKKWAAGGALRL